MNRTIEKFADEFAILRDSDCQEEKLSEWRQSVGKAFGEHKNKALQDIREILKNRAKKTA